MPEVIFICIKSGIETGLTSGGTGGWFGRRRRMPRTL